MLFPASEDMTVSAKVPACGRTQYGKRIPNVLITNRKCLGIRDFRASTQRAFDACNTNGAVKGHMVSVHADREIDLI